MDAYTGRNLNRVIIVIPPMIAPTSIGKIGELPLGPAWLAASLEKSGHTVGVIDSMTEGFNVTHPYPGNRYSYGLDLEEILKRVSEFKPDVVGISCPSSLQFEFSKDIARKIMTWPCPPIIAIGGAHVSALPVEVMSTGLFDMVFAGEADETFPAALRAISDGNLGKLHELPGLCFKGKNGLKKNPDVGRVENLDSLPHPARHLFPMDKYASLGGSASHDSTFRRKPFTQVITSRGCPGRCSFCSVRSINGVKWRPRSVDSVMEELWELKERWGIREVQFEDDNITLNRDRATSLFRRMLDEKIDLAWSVPNGVALMTLDNELIDLMAESGCYKLVFPIESGVQRVLDEVIEKKLDLSIVPGLIERAKKNRMAVQTLFVVGFPRETRREMEETFKYARKLHSDWTSFFIATPYPGTPLYREALTSGLIPDDFSFDSLDVRIASLNHPEISSTDLMAWVAREEILLRVRNYLRPENFNRAVRRLSREPKRLAGYFGNLLRLNVGHRLRAGR